MQGIPEMYDIPTMRVVSAFTMVRNLIIGSGADGPLEVFKDNEAAISTAQEEELALDFSEEEMKKFKKLFTCGKLEIANMKHGYN